MYHRVIKQRSQLIVGNVSHGTRTDFDFVLKKIAMAGIIKIQNIYFIKECLKIAAPRMLFPIISKKRFSDINTSKSIVFINNFGHQAPLTATIRNYSSVSSPSNVDLNFEDFQALMTSGNIQLVDVRETKEIEEYGEFPNAINIPLRELKTALQKSDADFLQTYGHEKPTKLGNNMVFTCKAGIRSMKSVNIAAELGFKARHYVGGWDEYHKIVGLPYKRNEPK